MTTPAATNRNLTISLCLFTTRLCLLALLVAVVCVGHPDSTPAAPKPKAASDEAAQQLSSEGQASLRAILQTGKLADMRWPDFSDCRADATNFYASYGNALPWVTAMQPTPQARAMIAILQNAGQVGLSPEDYDASRWAARLALLRPAALNPKESDLVRFDVALTVSAMRYISALHVGRINPKHVNFEVDVSKRQYNLPQFLRDDVVRTSNLPAVLQQVEPPYPGYRRTIEALRKYSELERLDNTAALPATKKPIEPGDMYPGVPRLIHFLQLVGDLPENAATQPNSTVYEGPLVDAVKRFQQRHGLAPDGRIGAQTLAALNVPLSRRVRQMELTLERWRWMPDAYQHAPIVVNIPEFQLRAYDDRFNIALTMRVVVGKAYGGRHNTPIFMGEMKTVVFRPYWNVPQSIATNEVIPAIKRNPGYLAKQNMELTDASGNIVSSGAVTDQMLQQAQQGKLYFRQRPGPDNALGLVKFLFPNDFSVYMHDTPSTQLFSRSRRDFSHGCIRLERPADLAVWVLRNNPGWDANRIRAAMDGTTTQEIRLARPIPVLIVYGTVIVPEDGTVHFYDDIYGYDALLERALDKGYPYPR